MASSCDKHCERESQISEHANHQIQHAEAVSTIVKASAPEPDLLDNSVSSIVQRTADSLPAELIYLSHLPTAEERVEARELTRRFFDDELASSGAQDLECLLYSLFRRTYFQVTDFVQSSWCEFQAVYAARHKNPTDIVHKVVSSLTDTKPEIKVGREIHKAKELEVAPPPSGPVMVVLPQDRRAVYLGNVLYYVKQLVFRSASHVKREMSIFGAINQEALIFGQIDELKLDADKYELELVELKTSKHSLLPRGAASDGHKTQVMMYAYLWNQLLFGGSQEDHFEALTPDIMGNLWHNIDVPLSDICRSDLSRAHGSSGDTVPYTSLRTILAELRRFGAVAPRVTKLTVRYVLQQPDTKRSKEPPVAGNENDSQVVAETETKEVIIGEVNYSYDHAWLKERIDRFVQALRGERELEGVPVEEAGKCKSCDFRDICEWRVSRAGGCRKSIIPALRLDLNEKSKPETGQIGTD